MILEISVEELLWELLSDRLTFGKVGFVFLWGGFLADL